MTARFYVKNDKRYQLEDKGQGKESVRKNFMKVIIYVGVVSILFSSM